jgi:hypothetical protein
MSRIIGRTSDWTEDDLRPDSQRMLNYGSLWVNVPDYEGEQRVTQLEFMNNMVDYLSRDMGVEFDYLLGLVWESINLVRSNPELDNLG